MAIAPERDPAGDAEPPPIAFTLGPVFPIGAYTRKAWREAALTRASEMGVMGAWARRATDQPEAEAEPLAAGLRGHLDAVKEAAVHSGAWRAQDALQERVIANLDAAEGELLRLAPKRWVRGQVPTLVARSRTCMTKDEPARQVLEEIALRSRECELDEPQRDLLIAATHAVAIERRHDVEQVRYLRNTLTLVLSLLTIAAVTFLLIGVLAPKVLPLCFASGGNVACPTSQTLLPPSLAGSGSGENLARADRAARSAASSWDIALVEMLGIMSAALSAGIALRGFRRRRSPYDFPRLLALIKLPTGALTAVLGLLLIRAQFVPGLSALDSATQIVAWSVVLGYSQYVFTRLIDQRAQTVLDAADSAPVEHSEAPAARVIPA